MKPILYQYWRSSSSWRVRWALAIKGIEFESVALDLPTGEQRLAAHRARNPMGYVPALEIDGRCLAESVAIFEYLEETVPTPALYPRDPWLRARARQVIETINAGIQPMQNLVTLQRHSDDGPAQRAWAAFFNERGLAALEGLLELIAPEVPPGPFAMGREFGAVDLFVVPQVASARRFGVELAAYPRVVAAEKAALATPHAERALPANQPGAPAR